MPGIFGLGSGAALAATQGKPPANNPPPPQSPPSQIQHVPNNIKYVEAKDVTPQNPAQTTQSIYTSPPPPPQPQQQRTQYTPPPPPPQQQRMQNSPPPAPPKPEKKKAELGFLGEIGRGILFAGHEAAAGIVTAGAFTADIAASPFV